MRGVPASFQHLGQQHPVHHETALWIFVEEILTHPLGSIAWEACRPHPAEH